MEPVLIDTNRTFGVELEGLIECSEDSTYISDISTRESPYYCECECNLGCTGECECSEFCFCDEYRHNYKLDNPEAEQDDIDNQECGYCSSNLCCYFFQHVT